MTLDTEKNNINIVLTYPEIGDVYVSVHYEPLNSN